MGHMAIRVAVKSGYVDIARRLLKTFPETSHLDDVVRETGFIF